MRDLRAEENERRKKVNNFGRDCGKSRKLNSPNNNIYKISNPKKLILCFESTVRMTITFSEYLQIVQQC